ncbi:ABC transporter substrate-binding protein [Arthrobacter sp. zg-Y769]|uniref:ABC transporter substrate-binding protein n=1 Tax=Arthrobacter sp. zg-Y769 TaxID=2894191 RepID=UPI001E4966CB|nr:ABC transporter substrate-binding protein [Arthrobacter sp. zg-Y769]MCC9204271.1 ABC transporter substrate-binding protein [Arthrobacter sp. zg-Y769]
MAVDGRTNGNDHYPVEVKNCGSGFVFNEAPEQLILLRSAPIPALHALGVLDRVVARAGVYPAAYYDVQTQSELDGITQLTDKTDSSGHLQISRETVLAYQPDLVLGAAENLNQAMLASTGTPLIEEPAFCQTTEGSGEPSFDSIYDQLEVYGEIFDRRDEAASYINSLKQRVSAAEVKPGNEDRRTAAVLYPTVGGGVTYAYGNYSMAQPQLEAAGFDNVFGNVKDRVFEVSLEELLNLNPDVLILLYSKGDPALVEKTVSDMAGAQRITAVANGDVLTHFIDFTEPATPLAVDGLEHIVERFNK